MVCIETSSARLDRLIHNACLILCRCCDRLLSWTSVFTDRRSTEVTRAAESIRRLSAAGLSAVEGVLVLLPVRHQEWLIGAGCRSCGCL
ncbi:hypothetical protein AOLI_G00322010 [Acnodon oligacanthus]